MTSAPRKPKAARPPRTPVGARGRARVDGILTALAEIIATEGVAAVTVSKVAKQSKTSIGSLYHFYTDVDSMLSALLQRHALGLRAIAESLTAADPDAWPRLSIEVVVDRITVPYLQYIRQNPDLLRLAHADAYRPEVREIDTTILESIGQVLTSRYPSASEESICRTAVLTHSVTSGAYLGASTLAPSDAAHIFGEVSKMLSAYYRQCEQDGTLQRAGRRTI